MAQWFSAPAKIGGAETARTEPRAEAGDDSGAASGPDSERRRRAAAYVDLWERHVTHIAAQGASGPRLRRGER